MPRFSITIDSDLVDLADQEARRTRSSRASVVRRALEAYFGGGENEANPLTNSTGTLNQNRTSQHAIR